MNFNDFLNEKNFQVVTSGEVINYRLSYQYGKGGFVAMASSGKELDKQIEIDDPDTIGKAIEDSINAELKKRRQLFTVEQDHGYQGAGYSFYFNMDGLIKLLNK
jgi:predicted heme/steroid binding protein